MTRRTRRNHTATFKTQVALARVGCNNQRSLQLLHMMKDETGHLIGECDQSNVLQREYI